MMQSRVVAEKWLDVRCILKKEPQIVLEDWIVWGGNEEKRRVQGGDKGFSLSS